MTTGKEKGYVLYDEVSELVPNDLNGSADLDDILAGLDVAGIEILEEPKLDAKLEEAEDLLDIELPTPGGDKTNDPVRMYLREMGAVPLLTREGEVEIAKRIERGQNTVLKALSRSPLVIQKITAMGDEIARCAMSARDILQISDPIITDETIEERKRDFLASVDEILRIYRKFQQGRQKLLAIPRGIKPKQHRRTRWEMGRLMVRVGRQIRGIKFQSVVIRHLIDCIRCAVEDVSSLAIKPAFAGKINSMCKHGECSLFQLGRQDVDLGPQPIRSIVRAEPAPMKLELRVHNASGFILLETVKQVGLNQLIDTDVDQIIFASSRYNELHQNGGHCFDVGRIRMVIGHEHMLLPITQT